MGPLKLTASSETMIVAMNAWRNASLIVHCPWDTASEGSLPICAEEPPAPEESDTRKRPRLHEVGPRNRCNAC